MPCPEPAGGVSAIAMSAPPGLRPRLRARRSLVLAAALGLGLALARPQPAAAVPPGVYLVRLEGVLGVERAASSIMQATLLLDGRAIPFCVTSARRMSGPPENGVGVLLPLGTDRPRIRLIGEPSFTQALAAAPAGTPVVLLGNLLLAMSDLELMGVDLPPSARPD